MNETTEKIIRMGEESTGRYVIVPVSKILFVDCCQQDGAEGAEPDYRIRIGLEGNGSGSEPLTLFYKDAESRNAEAERIASALSGVDGAEECGNDEELPNRVYDAVVVVRPKWKGVRGCDVRIMTDLINDENNDSFEVSNDRYSAYGIISKVAEDIADMEHIRLFVKDIIDDDVVTTSENMLFVKEKGVMIYVCVRE